jgi:hypothetical protein
VLEVPDRQPEKLLLYKCLNNSGIAKLDRAMDESRFCKCLLTFPTADLAGGMFAQQVKRVYARTLSISFLLSSTIVITILISIFKLGNLLEII